MFELKSTTRPIRHALLVSVCWQRESGREAASLLDELQDLVDTLGIVVASKQMVNIPSPQSRYLMGKGKAEEIAGLARDLKVDVVIFDQEITPAQQRNWEKLLENRAVIDREQVILDIFARRARTQEARLQIELACMEYSLPRLTRAWAHFSRQAGSGFGMTGAGETQLEVDRRIVRRRIDRLKIELTRIRQRRATRRKLRRRFSIPHAAIVGYTNAGKSTLFNHLTSEKVLVEDKLFATLDTTTRHAQIAPGCGILITDTVGFVRQLPHRLVESFKATLEESVLADFLIHVLDASNPSVLDFHRTTMNVLEELGADMKHVFLVFNKIDRQPDKTILASLSRQFPDALFISALTGDGVTRLKEHLHDLASRTNHRLRLAIPQKRYDLVSELHRHATIHDTRYQNDSVLLTVSLPANLLPLYQDFVSKS
ncbi:MAG: GTPase HflX [Verrucomicrobiae bacterium]|nr:GTPase HflX [Verrucomicrobiae bacterium]